jgi:hypothetical protein
MNTLTFFALTSLLPSAVSAATITSYTYVVNTAVPDNSGIGLVSTQWITAPIIPISGVTVQLTLAGGWSGDLYAYVTHDTGFAVLLNRPGRTLADPSGSGATDLSVNLDDNASADIHTGIPNSGSVAGTYQADGRSIDPDNALDTTPRTAFLSSFNGLDPNGEWSLYVADVATGDTMTLASWSLNITLVPEPSTFLLVPAGGCLLLWRRRAAFRE